MSVRTHTSHRVVNRASRFHRSAGIEDMEPRAAGRHSPIPAASGSPGSSPGMSIKPLTHYNVLLVELHWISFERVLARTSTQLDPVYSVRVSVVLVLQKLYTSGYFISGRQEHYRNVLYQNSMNNNMGNPRLPPYPHPTTVHPVVQVIYP